MPISPKTNRRRPEFERRRRGVLSWLRQPAYFLQQASQAPVVLLQHSAHLPLQQALQASTEVQEDRVATAARARMENSVFMIVM